MITSEDKEHAQQMYEWLDNCMKQLMEGKDYDTALITVLAEADSAIGMLRGCIHDWCEHLKEMYVA